jgi:hypothetical protein
VIAIEKDPLALYGGEVLLPVIGMADTPGLVARLKEAVRSGSDRRCRTDPRKDGG